MQNVPMGMYRGMQSRGMFAFHLGMFMALQGVLLNGLPQAWPSIPSLACPLRLSAGFYAAS